MSRRMIAVPLALILSLISGTPALGQGSSPGPSPDPSTGPPAACVVSVARAVSSVRPALLAGRWRRLPNAPISDRDGPVVAWTGAELLIWGGAGTSGRTGAAYDPTTRHWRPVPTAPMIPDPAIPAVWTGTELIVWGGRRPGSDPHSWPRNEAAAFDPSANTWRRIASPEGASGPVTDLAVWTGAEMLAWGWFGGSSSRQARLLAYSPTTDVWRETAPAPVPPVAPGSATMTWTGSELVVVDYPYDEAVDDVAARAAVYTPATDTWRDLGTLPMLGGGVPDAHAAGDTVLLMNAYQWPDEWSSIGVASTRDLVLSAGDGCDRVPAPAPWTSSTGSASAWTGRLLLFPGARGLAYDPAADSWLRLPRAPRLEQALIASATWATDRLFVRGAPYLPALGRDRADSWPMYEFIPSK